MLLVKFLERVENGRSRFSVLISQIKEIDNFANSRVFDYNHVLGQHFKQGE